MPKPVKILIVEDEMIIAADLSLTLEEMGYEVDAILPRGEDAVRHCRESAPDLILLDIQLKGLLDGVETARVLKAEGSTAPMIYLTANDDRATFDRARATQPEAFLAKPYDRDRLQRAIELAVGRYPEDASDIASSTSPEPAAAPKKASPLAGTYLLSDRIFVRHNDRMVKLFLEEISCAVAERSYCRIFTDEAEYLLSMPLSNLSKQLPDELFVRIHRSYVVNLTRVDEVAENHIVVSERAIPIGKSYRDTFLQRLQLIR